MLQEQDRTKLDGIVQQMIANKESDSNIQFVVNDFKQRYSKPDAQSNTGSLLTNNPITRFVEKRGNELADQISNLSSYKPMTIEQAKNPSPQQMQDTMGLALGFTPAGIEESTVGGLKATFPKVAEKLEGGVAKSLQQGAEGLVGKILRPTTNLNKELTQKIAPEFVEKAPFAFTRKGFLSKVEQQVENYGQQIGAKFEALPPESKDALQPILKRITEAQDRLSVKGTQTISAVNHTEHEALSTLKRELVDLAGNTQEIHSPVLRSYLQSLDSAIAKSGKGFSYSAADKASLAAQKTTSNIIRDEMAKARPDIAEINKAYTFWKRLQTLTEATMKRQTGQIGGVRKSIAAAGGVAAGSYVGEQIGGTPGAVIGAVSGALVTGNLQGILDSPAFKLLSIQVRNKAAEILASGNSELAARFLNRHLARIKGASLQTKSSQ